MAKLKRKYRTLRATLPNAGVEAAYRKQLLKIVNELMGNLPGRLRALDLNYNYVMSQFAEYLRSADVTERFQREAERIAKTFVNRATNYTKSALVTALEKENYNPRNLISLRRSPEKLEAVRNAVYRENVKLITDIPEETARHIETVLNRSITRGHDLGGMVEELQKIDGMTKRRAQIIARDQNNKVTQSMSLVRVQSMGITHGVWMHRSGSKVPRPEHQAMNGERFLLAEGLYDMVEGRNVLPAEMYNCRCTYLPVLPDLE